MSFKDWKGKNPNWCAGCGDYGVLTGLQKAVDGLGLKQKDTLLATGIGCSGNLTAFFQTFGIHGIHGRVLPLATGIKAAKPNATVIAAGGDGDGFGIGLGHFVHAARRNVDITYIVMDNQVYGLTKGQGSPTTGPDMKLKASPMGPQGEQVHPLELALTAGASFIAQAFSGDQKGLVDMIQQAINHRGFALVLVQSPCVTYNHVQTYAWFQEHMQEVPVGHDVSSIGAARKLLHEIPVPIGVIVKQDKPVYVAASTNLHEVAQGVQGDEFAGMMGSAAAPLQV